MGEVISLINAYQEEKLDNYKMKIVMMDVQAKQIVEYLTVVLSKEEVKTTDLWDFYPKLFDDEKEKYQKQNEAQELERFKEKRARFIAQHNRRVRGC